MTVEEMECEDGSGSFVFRVYTEIDAGDPDYAPETVFWSLTGGPGYEGVVGFGESSLPEPVGEGVFLWQASGVLGDGN